MDLGAPDDGPILDIMDPDAEYMSEYWTVLGVNRSQNSEMVSQSGRISVLVFGTLLAVWSLFLHVGILCIVSRRRPAAGNTLIHGRHIPLHWLVVSSSLGQVGMIVFVLPIELLTEYNGAWTLGSSFCRWWRPIHIGLIALYFWGHFAITVERYLRCVRARGCYRDGGCAVGMTLTCFAVLTSWLVSFVCAVIITMVMRHSDALQDDVCAMSMSVNMAFVLSFTLYFAPVALIITASAALLFVRCQTAITFSPSVRTHSCAGCSPDPARRLAKSTGRGSMTSLEGSDRGMTLERNCARALLIASADVDVTANDLRTSVTVAMVANVIAITCWMPFYVTNLMVPFCKSVCVDPALWTLFLWFGYSSVGLSPIVWFFEPTIRAKARSAFG